MIEDGTVSALRDAVGGVLRAWKGAGGLGGLEGLGRALRALERAYGEDGKLGSAEGLDSPVLGYGYRVLAGDPVGAVYALRWGAGNAGGAITGVVGPIEGIPPLPGGMTEAQGRRQWKARRAALESLPDPGSLGFWSVAVAFGQVQWARAQSWRFPEPAGIGVGRGSLRR